MQRCETEAVTMKEIVDLGLGPQVEMEERARREKKELDASRSDPGMCDVTDTKEELGGSVLS